MDIYQIWKPKLYTWDQVRALEQGRQGYETKLTLSHGSMLPDSDTLDDWKNDVTLLPDVNWSEVYNYLINKPNNYTNESLKAYKSLEA